jgi:hypothetical protein
MRSDFGVAGSETRCHEGDWDDTGLNAGIVGLVDALDVI